MDVGNNREIDVSRLETLDKGFNPTMKRTSTGYTWTRITVLAILLLLNGCTHNPTSITHEIHQESPVISTSQTEPGHPIFTTFLYVVLTGAVIAIVVDAIKLETKWYFL
jgi:uncharacterized integral membrane protein